jgi:hypothetical protein
MTLYDQDANDVENMMDFAQREPSTYALLELCREYTLIFMAKELDESVNNKVVN